MVNAIVDEGLGNSSYLVDLGDGGALMVDPERDSRPYLVELERRLLQARFVVRMSDVRPRGGPAKVFGRSRLAAL